MCYKGIEQGTVRKKRRAESEKGERKESRAATLSEL